MLTKAFHFNILKKFFVTFAEQADDFIKCVQEEVGKKRTDLFHMVSNMTLSIMCGNTEKKFLLFNLQIFILYLLTDSIEMHISILNIEL